MPLDDDVDAVLRLLQAGEALYADGDSTRAAESFRRAGEACRRIGLIEAEVRARLGLGRCLRQLRQAEAAIKELEVAASMAEVARDKPSQLAAGELLGNLYLSQGRWEQGLDVARRTLALARQLGDSRAQASAFGLIGQLHRRKGDMGAALDAAMEGLQLAQKIGHVDEELAFFGDMVLISLRKGEPKEAESLARRGLERARAAGKTAQVATFLGQLCHAARALGEPDRARAFADEGLEAARQAGDAREQAAFLQDLGEMDEAEGRIAEAVVRFEESLRILDRIGYREGLILGYRRLALLLAASRDPKRGMASLAHAMILAFPVDPRLFKETFAFVFQAFSDGWSHGLYDELLAGLEHVDQSLTMALEAVTRETEGFIASLRDAIEALSLLAESRGEKDSPVASAALSLAAQVEATLGIQMTAFVEARLAPALPPPARPTGEPIH